MPGKRFLASGTSIRDRNLAVAGGEAAADLLGLRGLESRVVAQCPPDGTLDRRIQTPVLKPTSVTFGGADLDVLFVTTMANPDLPVPYPKDGPLAGSIFAVRGLGVTGVPQGRFRG